MVSGWVEARGGRRANADAAVPHSYTWFWVGGWWMVWVVETGLRLGWWCRLVGDYSVWHDEDQLFLFPLQP